MIMLKYSGQVVSNHPVFQMIPYDVNFSPKIYIFGKNTKKTSSKLRRRFHGILKAVVPDNVVKS
jgi:hypothetical protein